MPQLQRKRHSQTQQNEYDSPESSPEPPTQRRRLSASPDFANDHGETQDSTQPTLVKKLVRMALASELNRKPIRRADVSEMVLGPSNARQFKSVFAAAQEQLRNIFAMEMVELPAKDKVTIQAKRAAAKSGEKAKAGTGTWVLVSTLPQAFRDPEILGASRVPTEGEELKYTGLYSVVVSLIMLNGGELADSRLERYLKRLKLDDRAPLGDGKEVTTAVLLKRMEKDAYINRVRETGPGGEEDVRWFVAPRGKVEIGEAGVRGLARTVYGDPEEADREELGMRLDRSLGVAEKAIRTTQTQSKAGAEKKRRGRRPREEAEQDGEEEEEDEDEED